MAFLKQFSIPERRDLWLAQLYYFTFMGGWGFLFPFVNLFYVSLGLKGAQIGTIASTAAIVGLISAPIWANEVKKHANPRIFLQIAMLFSATFYILIGQQSAFLPILVFVAFQAMSGAGILPMADSMAVTVAQANQKGYGGVRMWGSLGWIFAVPFSGWLIERLGFHAGFWGLGLSFLTGVGLLFFIRPQQFTHPTAGEKSKGGLRLAVKKVLADRTLLGFALALIFVGFLNNGVLQFENVFLSKLGATKQLISIAGILSAIVELPFMLFADRIIHRYGAHRLMFVALVFNIFLRLTVLTFPAIVTIMIVRFIGGVSFSLYTVAFVGLISERTESHERGTVLALYTVTIAGSVSIIASPIAGVIFDAIGARWLYAFSAAGYLAAVVSMWLTRPPKAAAVVLE
jgi:MFS transporter, PPP family, 3-phenylpropionic acid transporter